MAQRWKRLSWRRRSIGVVAALALLAIVPIQMATGQTTEPVPFDAGFVRLHMNTDGSYFRYEPLTGSNTTQSFSANTTKCVYQPGAGGQSLIAVSSPIPPNASKSVVGYQQKENGYGLGVNKGGKEGSGSCNQTNLNEKLVLELQNDSGPLEGLYVDYAELDFELKFNPTLSVQMFNGTASVGTFEIDCSASDCGPDSADQDNFRLLVRDAQGDLFDRIEISVTSSNNQAAATLEAGVDGTAPHPGGLGESLGTKDSLFHVVQLLNAAECGVTFSGEGGGTAVDITLVDTEDCSPKGYALDVDAREIELITGGGAVGQWVVEVDDWAPETAQNPVPASRVFPPEPDGELVVWCDGAFNAGQPPSSGGTYGASMPSGHSWCLIRQDSAIADNGEMQVNETLLLEADARIARG